MAITMYCATCREPGLVTADELAALPDGESWRCVEHRDHPSAMPAEPSRSTEYRRRKDRKDKVNAILRDGRTTPESALERVRAQRTDDDSRWRKKCIVCGREFTPKRSDAQTCSDGCRVAAHRARVSGS